LNVEMIFDPGWQLVYLGISSLDSVVTYMYIKSCIIFYFQRYISKLSPLKEISKGD